MEFLLRFDGSFVSDDYRSLRAELLERDVPQVGIVERAPAAGTLGPVLDALQVLVAPGAGLSAVVAGVVTWIRHRHGEVDVQITDTDGRSVTVSAKRVQNLQAGELLAEIERIRTGLAPPDGSD